MSRFGSNYQIARPTGRCASTGEPLEAGMACVATLCEPEREPEREPEGEPSPAAGPMDEAFVRLDFSVSAWDEGARPDRLFSFWRMVVPSAEEKKNLLVDDDVLFDLFERLASEEQESRVAFRFVLALILMRKRRLRFVGREGTGADEIWKMIPKGADPESEPMRVRNPHLSDDDVRELTAQLSEILQGDVVT